MAIFLPPPRPRCYELLIKQAADRLKITCIPSRLSILTRPHNGRKACHYCGQCGRGCAIHANFSSPSVLLPPALATGRLTLVTRAMAREVTDRRDRPGHRRRLHRHRRPAARTTCARGSSCWRPARASRRGILLNSTSSRFPHGLANSSGAVGRYLTDTTGVSVSRLHPEDDGRRAAQRGRRRRHASLHAVVARQPDARFPARLSHRARRRAADAGRRASSAASIASPASPGRPADRAGRLRQGAQGRLPALLRRDRQLLGPRRDDPERDSYCEIDPVVVDRWGIPVLRFHFKWSDYEFNQVRHMQQTFRALIDRHGRHAALADAARERGYGIAPGGRIIHEVGVTRMGHSPTTSVLNAALPGPRRQQPVRRRRRAVRHQRRQERDLDDPGARDADQRVHRRRSGRRGAI